MSLRSVLPLTTVQVAREVETTDGMGGISSATTLTTLGYASIWQNNGHSQFFSDKVNRVSTHVLATEPSGYAWTSLDRYVVYDSDRYKIVGRPDDVSQKNELTIVNMDIIT